MGLPSRKLSLELQLKSFKIYIRDPSDEAVYVEDIAGWCFHTTQLWNILRATASFLFSAFLDGF